MDLTFLGSFTATLHGRSVTPTASKPRQILALLAANANQTVSIETLMSELWADNAPRSASTTLQTYILQIRTLIARALTAAGHPDVDPKLVLRTHLNGYRLDVGDGARDSADFARIGDAAFAAKEAGDLTAASALFKQALDLWDGSALADINPGPMLDIEVQRLEESRLCVLDAQVEVELSLGRHREMLSVLSQMTKLHPTNERLFAQYMVALARSGRRGESLIAFQRLRGTLVRELGLEPSPALKRLQHAILTSTLPPAESQRATDRITDPTLVSAPMPAVAAIA